MLKKFCGFEIAVTNMIYCASKDGFASTKFHSKVDGAGKTLIIIRSADGSVFGGFTDLGFDSTSSYKTDPKAFLFHVTKESKIESNCGGSNAMYCSSSYAATFGSGHDLYICDNSDSSNSSYSNLGNSYKCPEGTTYGNDDAKAYFAGAYNFTTKEIEAFSFIAAE